MKLLFLTILILLAQNNFSQDQPASTFTIPSKEKLKNIDKLNKLAIASNGGALGCGVMYIEKDGKQYDMGASLEFMLDEEKQADVELLHAILYARYANIILNDTTWPFPNSSLCYTATEVLAVFHNQDSPKFLCLLFQDKSRERIALIGMEKMGRIDVQTRKELSECVENYLLPSEFRVSGWIEKEMRQPLSIKAKGKDKVKVNRKVLQIEGLKQWLENYKEEYGDDYVYIESYEDNEVCNNIIQIINSAGFNLVDPDDFQ